MQKTLRSRRVGWHMRTDLQETVGLRQLLQAAFKRRVISWLVRRLQYQFGLRRRLSRLAGRSAVVERIAPRKRSCQRRSFVGTP